MVLDSRCSYIHHVARCMASFEEAEVLVCTCQPSLYDGVLCSPHVLQLKAAAAPPGTEDQERLLKEALNIVKKYSFEMKTCLVSGN